MAERTCSIDGCEKAAHTRGWCRMHYMRWYRWGDPEGSAPRRPLRPLVKRCSVCRVRLSPENCNRSSRTRDGLQNTCRKCLSEYRAEWHRRNRERLAPIRAAYREANAQAVKDYHRRYGREWRAENPGLVREYASKRRAKIRDAWGEYVDRDVVWARDGGICHLCGLPADPDRWDLDHIIPPTPRPGQVAGRHNYGNVAVSHPSCNYRKKNRIVTHVDR